MEEEEEENEEVSFHQNSSFLGSANGSEEEDESFNELSEADMSMTANLAREGLGEQQ